MDICTVLQCYGVPYLSIHVSPACKYRLRLQHSKHLLQAMLNSSVSTYRAQVLHTVSQSIPLHSSDMRSHLDHRVLARLVRAVEEAVAAQDGPKHVVG